ncbi:MAG: hypothetical protein RH947_02890 [Alcanivorax sp.]
MDESSDQRLDAVYATRVKSSRVFILGAGFSASAGVPLTNKLLAQAMSMFSVECPGLYERISGYTAECFELGDADDVDYEKVDFSELCTFLEYIELREFGGGERWKDTGSREKLALRFYLSKTISEVCPDVGSIPELYSRFARNLNENDVVISFNWDPLLERALIEVGKTFTYNFQDPKGIKLCKLHGSVNWRLGELRTQLQLPASFSWESLKFTEGMMNVEMYHSPELIHSESWSQCRPLGEVEPFLVLPGYGKGFDVRANAVLWYKPEFAFSFTHDVYIIGLSLAPDDFFVRSLFLSNLPFIDRYSGVEGRHIHIINPASDAAQNYEFVLSKGNATLHNENFSMQHVELMERCADA